MDKSWQKEMRKKFTLLLWEWDEISFSYIKACGGVVEKIVQKERSSFPQREYTVSTQDERGEYLTMNVLSALDRAEPSIEKVIETGSQKEADRFYKYIQSKLEENIHKTEEFMADYFVTFFGLTKREAQKRAQAVISEARQRVALKKEQ